MAATKKKASSTRKTTSSTRSSTASKKSTAASRTRKYSKKAPSYSRPLLGFFVFALGIIMLFCLVSPSNAVGIISIRSFFNGLFGSMAILIGIIVVMGGLQILMGSRWPVSQIVLLQCLLIVFCVATLLQVFRFDDLLRGLSVEGYRQNYNGFLWKSYEISKNVATGGGSMGALLAYPMAKFLDIVFSALLLFFAIFGLALWMVRTLVPTAGETIATWIAQMQDNYSLKRNEREDEKEAKRRETGYYDREEDIIRAQLTQQAVQDGTYAKNRPVAKGRKVSAPSQEPVPAATIPQQPLTQLPPQQVAYATGPVPVQHTAPWVPLENTAPVAPVQTPPRAETPKAAPAKPRTARLYIENDGPPVVPPSEEAYTDYDIERAKYATRPARKNPDEVPDFVLKRKTEQLAEAPSEDAETYETATPFAQEEPQKTAKSRRRPAPTYQVQNYLDKEPQLDPETQLDRADWKPPEPEAPEDDLEEGVIYRKPPFSLLEQDTNRVRIDTTEADEAGIRKLEDTLQSFGVKAKVTLVVHGPAITRYELQPAPGVKVSKIVNLTDDIALNMAAVGVRIEAPIPGKAAVGIEIANDTIQMVKLRDVLESKEFIDNPSRLAVGLGKDIAGKRIIADLAKMPHVLIAGATGSGKSVCINTIITSIIYRSTPEEVRMILIDPKKVELAVYNGIPHLLVPVVTDPKKASGALNWAVMEMDERYRLFAEKGVRDIKGYNAHRDEDTPLMPQIVVIIDELSDLMLVAPGEVEEAICRLAQLARACGIHLVIATQRPSVNVITGIIKANVPSRIAFAVSSQVDSRTILDGAGAEKLLGKGDMLYAPSGGGKPLRVQGCFVSDDEVTRVVEYVKDRSETEYNQAVIDALDSTGDDTATAAAETHGGGNNDPLFEQAVEMAIESGQASISMVQRRLRVGYARAGRIIDEMTQQGIISAADGAKPREVLISREEFNMMFKST